MHVNPRPASVRPYPPSLYLPGSYGRFRQYPRVVETPIPGAGYHVGEMVWGEQMLDLDGSRRPYPYGQYAAVPLRGLGQDDESSRRSVYYFVAALALLGVLSYSDKSGRGGR
jgi:hypothetical protein